MKIRPYGGMILVSRDSGEKLTAGGLHIPDSAQKKLSRGEVLAVGPGRVDEDGVFRAIDDIKPGDRLVWDRNGAHDVPWQDGYVLVSHEYVLAKLDAA